MNDAARMENTKAICEIAAELELGLEVHAHKLPVLPEVVEGVLGRELLKQDGSWDCRILILEVPSHTSQAGDMWVCPEGRVQPDAELGEEVDEP